MKKQETKQQLDKLDVSYEMRLLNDEIIFSFILLLLNKQRFFQVTVIR